MFRALALLSPMYIFMLVCFYWMFQWHFLPTEIISVKLLTEEVRPGQNITVETVARRKSSCQASRSHFLVSDVRQTRLSPTDNYTVFKEPFPVTVNNVVNIPKDIQPGRYEFLIQTTYYCNPIDYILNRHRTVSYGMVTILPPKETDEGK